MKTVELSDEAFAMLCGMVHGSEEVSGINQDGIMGNWGELQEKFPREVFEARAKEHGEDFYIHEAGL